MRRLLMALVFITFLVCAPAFAGHVNAGGGWCECGSFAACICDPGETPPIGSSVAEPDGLPDKSTQDAPVGLGSEMLFVLAALILVLRYKA